MIKAGVNVNSSYETQLANNFSSLTTNSYQFSLGQPPPANGQDWTQLAVISSAMDPIQYTLVNISELFGSDFTRVTALNDRCGG
jgi:hypothetical protein